MERYAVLRGCLKGKGIDQKYLCELLDHSQSYITSRITGKKPWTQKDQYTLLDILNIPYEKMHIIFPKDGIRYEGITKNEDNDPLYKFIRNIGELINTGNKQNWLVE